MAHLPCSFGEAGFEPFHKHSSPSLRELSLACIHHYFVYSVQSMQYALGKRVDDGEIFASENSKLTDQIKAMVREVSTNINIASVRPKV